MTIDDKIRDENLKYDINREAALLFGKINKYEYLTGKQILAFNQGQMIEQDKFRYFPLVKAFSRRKTNESN